MRPIRIVFMGTPDFAVASLDALLKANYNVAAVVTAPDKPAGRGQKIHSSSVKKYAVKNGLKVLQPTKLKDAVFVQELKDLQANLFIVVAFRMLPEVVWKMPLFGTFNLHASLLPDYRGAAPINWAIINGETRTGVSTFFIDHTIDTGHIIQQEALNIGEDEILGTLYNRLMIAGSQLVVSTVKLIEKNQVRTLAQVAQYPKLAPKIFPDTCQINWQDSIDNIYNLIRGLNPYPAAWTSLHDDTGTTTVKIFDVSKATENHDHPTGTILSTKKSLRVAVKGGYIEIRHLQLAGRRKMSSRDLLNGHTFSEKSMFR